MHRRRFTSQLQRELLVTTAVGALWILLNAVYSSLGHRVVAGMYSGTLPISFFNELITGQAEHSFAYYVERCNNLYLVSTHWVFLSLNFLVFLWYHSHRLLNAFKTGSDDFVGALNQGSLNAAEVGALRYLSPALMVALLIFAWGNRFIQDDAFISFRYAANLVNGHGLTWNHSGEHIEGYTNFLWTILMTIPVWLHYDVALFAQIVGIVCFAGTLYTVYHLSAAVLSSYDTAALVVLALGGNYTFSAYATGGLETQLQTLLLVATTYVILRSLNSQSPALRHLVAASLLAGAALLTRLDSALPLAVLVAYCLYSILKSSTSHRPLQIVALFLPAGVLMILFAFWKLGYYGELLPNTYYAKVSDISSSVDGFLYVSYFVFHYGFTPFVFIYLTGIRRLAAILPHADLLACLVAAWLVYVIKVGGCFMEFRLLVAILPFAMILLVATIALLPSALTRLALVLALMAGSIAHSVLFTGWHGIESVRSLQEHITVERWADIGHVLGRLFSRPEQDVVIATTAAGAIPYYSGLTTVDMLGLNDRWIARYGHFRGTRPGHQRIATAQYLVDCGVNLVVGHPTLRLSSSDAHNYSIRNTSFSMARYSADVLPETARVLEIPVGEKDTLLVLYLIPSPAVDNAIREFGIEAYPITR